MRESRAAHAVIHGSAPWNRPFHCSVCSVYLTFYCRNIVLHSMIRPSKLFAVWCDLWSRISVSGAKAPLCGHTETGMWRHCLRPKKVAFRTFRVRKSASNLLLYMKDLQMCAYCPDSRHVPYCLIHCQRLKLNVDFRGESVQWSQTPSPLAYAVYAFINVDNCERPLNLDCKYFSYLF